MPLQIIKRWLAVGWEMARVAWLLMAGSGPEGREAIKRLVRAQFHRVPQISTAELAAWLADSARTPPVILDVRAEQEFEVSHLHGARCVGSHARAGEVAAVLDLQAPVVVYCSVGYRSSALAEQLRRAGFTQVSNLEGSIFQWAAEGRPLEAAGKPTREVHPCHSWFRKLAEARDRKV